MKGLFFILAMVAVIFWMFTLASQPGGYLMYGSLLLTVLGLISLYGAFFSPLSAIDRYVLMGNGAIVGGFCLALAIGTAYISYHQRQGPDMIAKWISVYPKISDITAIPPMKHDFIWSFIVKCDATEDRVSAYYEDPSHTDGWTMLDDSNPHFLELKKPGYRLFLLITPDDFGKKTSIQYQMEDRQHHMYAQFR